METTRLEVTVLRRAQAVRRDISAPESLSRVSCTALSPWERNERRCRARCHGTKSGGTRPQVAGSCSAEDPLPRVGYIDACPPLLLLEKETSCSIIILTGISTLRARTSPVRSLYICRSKRNVAQKWGRMLYCTRTDDTARFGGARLWTRDTHDTEVKAELFLSSSRRNFFLSTVEQKKFRLDFCVVCRRSRSSFLGKETKVADERDRRP